MASAPIMLTRDNASLPANRHSPSVIVRHVTSNADPLWCNLLLGRANHDIDDNHSAQWSFRPSRTADRHAEFAVSVPNAT
jgi:hypothetical protein